MNIKMAINSQLSTIESQKQTGHNMQNRNRITDMEIIGEGYQLGGGRGRIG